MNLRMTPLFAESWSVAYRKKTKGSILHDLSTPFHIIPNSFRYWAADPMVFVHEGKTYIFAELFDYSKYRGIIGVTVFNGQRFSRWKPVLIAQTHLSYPFVFCHEDQIYMLPENEAGGKLTLYRAVDFPLRWEPCRILAEDVRWVDTTLHPTADGFIGFTESMEEPISDYLLRFDRRLELTECTPIEESGSNCHRCGGPMFMHEGHLVRVTQDCAHDYGQALYFRMCDPVTLSEEYAVRMTPQQLRLNQRIFLQGMHTYSSSGDFEVIDIKTRRLVPVNLFYRTFGKVKMLIKSITRKGESLP